MQDNKVNINTNNITTSGFNCFVENGFVLNENDVFISTSETVTLMTAIANKDNKSYTFRMNLNDTYFICVEDSSFKYDMSKYKFDDFEILESFKETEKRINERTPVEWVNYYRNNTIDFIELHNEEPEKYPKTSIEREYISMIEKAKEANIDTLDSINDLEFYLSNESIERAKEFKWK